MTFYPIEDAFSVARKHLLTLDDTLPDTEKIESFFVASIVLLIVSHYESHIARQFVRRAERSGDQHVTSYVRHHTARQFRSPDIRKITEALNQFGSDYKERFSDQVMETQAQLSWDTILKNRHGIVHDRRPPSMTLRELEEAYRGTQGILAALSDCLESTASGG